MSSSKDAGFGYRIAAVDGGWSWVAFDTSGRIQDSGRAPSKALAAACVIRALARSAAPEAALKTAA